MLVNDIHSQLNETEVEHIHTPTTIQELSDIVRMAKLNQRSVCISGGRHAMGGQQFCGNKILLDLRSMDRVCNFDPDIGLIEIEAGIQWPQLIETLRAIQQNSANQWSIIQKQTGADRLTLGGSLSANVHGRGLKFKPMIADVESFVLINAQGEAKLCDRTHNAELFRLVIGGYGLFGVIAKITLRLCRRERLQRIVKIIQVLDLPELFEQRIAEGFVYGDFQFSTDRNSDDFLSTGVFSCYQPFPEDAPLSAVHLELKPEDWVNLYALGHSNQKKAFELYSQFYLATSGQIYDSDTHQLSYYLDDYHKLMDQKSGFTEKATEMITELYVPRNDLVWFLQCAARYFMNHQTEVFYGTVRLIEKDNESFLAWAKQPFVCVIFNLHVVHNPVGLKNAQAAFRHLIHLAIKKGGSYYLTYHRWATKKQVQTCYPQMVDFLRLKKKYDPHEIFQSDWYCHYKRMFRDKL